MPLFMMWSVSASEWESSREVSWADPQAVRRTQPDTVWTPSPLRILCKSPLWVLGLLSWHPMCTARTGRRLLATQCLVSPPDAAILAPSPSE